MLRKTEKTENGFTIAELLVVVAIIGILVAVSIPIFTGQLRKAKVATNKANIRAARAAAIAQYYTDEAAGYYPKATSHTYYYYDVSSGKIDFSKTKYNQSNYASPLGTEAYKTAKDYKVCTFIIVYVAPNSGEKGATIQTAPYYTEESGDLPAWSKGSGGDNYFGPTPGK